MTDAPAAPPAPMSIEATLQKLYDQAPRVALGTADRIVIMSDLHLGDGGPRDDFRPNAELVHDVLRDYYLEAGYSLVLNGDIEELQRFSYAKIRKRPRNRLLLCGWPEGLGIDILRKQGGKLFGSPG